MMGMEAMARWLLRLGTGGIAAILFVSERWRE